MSYKILKSWTVDSDLYEIKEFSKSVYYYKNGLCHRLDGPAMELANGTKAWYQNDRLHRIDRPAIEYSDGTKEWYVRNQDITDWIHQQGISDNPTQEEQILISLHF